MRLLGVHRWHHRKGGAEGVHLDHLALFRERGWECAEFAVDHPDNEPSQWRDYFATPLAPPGAPASPRCRASFIRETQARNSPRLLDDFRPNVIHAHGIYHHLTNAILAPARRRRVPIVYTLHDYKLICPAYHFYTPQNGVCERCRGGQQWRCLTNRCTQGPLAVDALYALDGWIQWHGGALRDASRASSGHAGSSSTSSPSTASPAKSCATCRISSRAPTTRLSWPTKSRRCAERAAATSCTSAVCRRRRASTC